MQLDSPTITNKYNLKIVFGGKLNNISENIFMSQFILLISKLAKDKVKT